MDMYFKRRIETIGENDFWSSIRKNPGTRDAIRAGLSGARDDAYRLLGRFHAGSLAAEAAHAVSEARRTGVSESLRRQADRVLRHEIQGWHTHVRTFGPVIDFNADFGQSGQYGFHYLGWLRPVLTMVLLGEDQVYRDELVAIVKQYYGQRTGIVRRIPRLHPVYYELGAWAKTNILLPAYAALAGDPALDTDAREAMLKLLLGFARSLYRLQSGGFRRGNWQIVGCAALYAIGAAFPEFRESAAWRKRAEEIMDAHARKDFFADGGHGERCWGYGQMSLNGMVTFYQSAQRHARLDSRRLAAWRRFLRRAYRWFPAATAPGLMMLNYGDGGIASARPLIAQALDHFPELGRGTGVLGVDRSRSNILRASGYAFMRDGDGDEAPFMSINFGPSGGGHTHQDLLDFSIWRYGRPLIEEVGRFGSYDNPLSPMFRSEESRNQVVIAHRTMNRGAHRGRDVHWGSSALADHFSAWHEAFERVRIHRQIIWIKPDAWIVRDVVSATEYIFQAVCCLHGTAAFKAQGPGAWRLAGAPGCLVICDDPASLRRVATGLDYNHLDDGAVTENTPVYQRERHHLKLSRWRDVGDARPIVFTTLLVPFQRRPPDAALEPLPLRGDASGKAGAYRVRLDGQAYDVVFNPGCADLSIGRKRLQALSAVRIGRQWDLLPAGKPVA